jgi:antirestriction protein ArdC
MTIMAKQASTTTRVDVYQVVTDRILASLEKGVAPWVKPWDASNEGNPMSEHANALTGKAYRGVNTLLLWESAHRNDFQATRWGTFKQWQSIGGSVRKGSKATHIVFWKDYLKEDAVTGEVTKIPVLRSYCVFNQDQVDHVDASKLAGFKRHTFPSLKDRNAAVEAWFGRIGSTIKFSGARAFYSMTTDSITMPIPDRFRSADDFYSTGAHEHVHWTGAASRLDRKLGGFFGSPQYGFEELVAELGSAFVCARLGVNLDRLQHAEYIGSWSRCLKDRKDAIVKAASLAQKACDFLFERAGELIADQGEDHDDAGEGEGESLPLPAVPEPVQADPVEPAPVEPVTVEPIPTPSPEPVGKPVMTYRGSLKGLPVGAANTAHAYSRMFGQAAALDYVRRERLHWVRMFRVVDTIDRQKARELEYCQHMVSRGHVPSLESLGGTLDAHAAEVRKCIARSIERDHPVPLAA